MKISNKILTTGIVSLVLAGASFTAFSGQFGSDGENPDLINQATVNIEQAMEIALKDVPGKVIEAEIEQDDGRLVWEIEVLTGANEVYEFEIDANDGRILDKERDDD